MRNLIFDYTAYRKDKILLNLFFICAVFYGIMSLFHTLCLFFDVSYYIYPRVGELLGAILLTFLTFTQLKIQKAFGGYLFTVFFLYAAGIVCMRGLLYNPPAVNALNSILGGYESIFALAIVPLTIMVGRSEYVLRALVKSVVFMDIVYLIMAAVFWRELMSRGEISWNENVGVVESLAKYLAYSNTLLIITFPYHNRKVKMLAVVTLLVMLLIALFNARRNQLLSIGAPAVLAYYYHFIHGKKDVRMKIFFIIMIICTAWYGYHVLSQDHDFFAFIQDKGVSNTRDDVHELFFMDFGSERYDWLFGRGMNGKYFCPSADVGDDLDDNMRRITIETGFLYYLLKGGIIYLALFCSLMLFAIYKAFHHSGNRFARSLGLMLLVALLEIIPVGAPQARYFTIVTWIACGLVMFSRLPRLTESEVALVLHGRTDEPGTFKGA